MRTKIIVNVAVIIILIVAGVVLGIMLWGENGGGGNRGGGKGGGGDNGYKFPTGATFGDKLRICLEQDLDVQECHVIYDDSENALTICESLGELKDNCIYKVAVENKYLELCQRINTAEIGTKCNQEIEEVMVFENE